MFQLISVLEDSSLQRPQLLQRMVLAIARVSQTMQRHLLKVADINSYYTLVLAGETRQLNHDFVANHFNHAILCVPMIKDTIWLDCTSQTLPFNFLGDFTDDRPALLITPEGGKLVRTPAFIKNENVFKRTGTVS